MLNDFLLKTFVNFAIDCDKEVKFLNLPAWHNGLTKTEDTVTEGESCSISIEGLADIWKIIANIIQLLLGLGVYVAIGFIIFGGVKIMLSQGSPDKIKEGKQTIINACIGLVICLVATTAVGVGIATFK